MKTPQSKTQRIYSLDSLRAIMMLLGLVLHSAITYGTVNYESSWAFKDPNSTHFINDLIVILIHSFRMPIFFVVAGFFGAMLFYERTPLRMIKNRTSRILYPFLVFLILFSPLLIFTNHFTVVAFSGNEAAFESTIDHFSNLSLLLPLKTYHLWFLYYLALITATAVVTALAFKKIPLLSGRLITFFNWMFKRPLARVLVFALMTFLIYLAMGINQVETSMSLVPDLNTFLFYGSFYFVGWVLYKSKHLLDTMKRFDWLGVIMGTLLIFTYIFTFDFASFEIKIMMSSLIVWLFVFGITGLFIRFGSKYSARMRYVSDASYWIYLFHLPFTVIIPALIFEWPVSAMTKFLIVLMGTAIPCFITYHYLIRPTFIGKFLNGRKYPLKPVKVEKSKSFKEVEHTTKREEEPIKEPSAV